MLKVQPWLMPESAVPDVDENDRTMSSPRKATLPRHGPAHEGTLCFPPSSPRSKAEADLKMRHEALAHEVATLSQLCDWD